MVSFWDCARPSLRTNATMKDFHGVSSMSRAPARDTLRPRLHADTGADNYGVRTSTLCTHVSGLLVCSTAIDRRNAGMRCDAPADAADAFPTRLTPNPRTEPTRNHIPRCKIWAQGPRGRQGWGRSGAEARGARRGWTNGWTHARTHELKGIRASTLKRLLRSPFFRVPRIKS